MKCDICGQEKEIDVIVDVLKPLDTIRSIRISACSDCQRDNFIYVLQAIIQKQTEVSNG